MSLSEIWEKFVAAFDESPPRTELFWKLEQVVQDLLLSGLPCEIWLDGSLLTKKPDPSDLDITLIVDAEVLGIASEIQNSLIDKLTIAGYGEPVDSFALTRFPRDSPAFGTELDELSSWNEVYGAEHSKEWLKGFVVLTLNETDVGLFLRRR